MFKLLVFTNDSSLGRNQKVSDLLVKEDRVEDDVNLALSAFILAVSLFLVSEN